MAVASTAHAADHASEDLVIPLVSEHADVAITARITGEVEVSTTSHVRDAVIDEALTSQHATIERVAIGRVVDAAPDIREEDGVLIIPVLEEIIVVEKRLVLKEEVRIVRDTTTRRHQEVVTLRQQEATVRRKPAPTPQASIQAEDAPVTPEEIKP